MKLSYCLVLVIALATISCQKDKGTTVATVTHEAVTPPVANFKISNTEDPQNDVLEGKVMNFENSSTNGDTYLWDFGNGTTSTDKVPTGITLWPCTSMVTVTLTVTNAQGKSASHSESYYVLCARLYGGTHVDHK